MLPEKHQKIKLNAKGADQKKQKEAARMADGVRLYECKHFCWTSWKQYEQKMWETGCKLRNRELGSCKGICEKFERRADNGK